MAMKQPKPKPTIYDRWWFAPVFFIGFMVTVYTVGGILWATGIK